MVRMALWRSSSSESARADWVFSWGISGRGPPFQNRSVAAAMASGDGAYAFFAAPADPADADVSGVAGTDPADPAGFGSRISAKFRPRS